MRSRAFDPARRQGLGPAWHCLGRKRDWMVSGLWGCFDETIMMIMSRAFSLVSK